MLVSPRLTCDAAAGTLAEFSDFLDWPAQVGGLTFTVEFDGGPTVAATRVTEPGFPALDSPAWKALFPTSFPVQSYAFDDRSNLAVRSFPTKKVLSFVTETYKTVAAQSPSQMPTLHELGFGREGGLVALDEIAIYGDEQAGLERGIDDTLYGKEKQAAAASNPGGLGLTADRSSPGPGDAPVSVHGRSTPMAIARRCPRRHCRHGLPQRGRQPRLNTRS